MSTRFVRQLFAPLVLFGLAASSLHAADPPQPSVETLPVSRMLGQRMANFELKDTEGKAISLRGFRGNLAVVLAFMGTDCPVGNLYAPRLVELNKTYKDKKVVFLGINSNASATRDAIAAHAKEYGLDFPVLKDEGNVVADMALVERTCEVVVLDGLGMVRYRGAIDDQYALGKRRDAPTQHYLRSAIDAILSGDRIETKAAPVVGCLIDKLPVGRSSQKVGNASRVRPAAPEITSAREEQDRSEEKTVGAVTYASDVAAIVQQKCQACHRPGEVGPFPLLTYDDARKHSGMIREVVDERRMPPWHADPKYGHFQNDRSLSSKERATLLAWVDQGAPFGDPKKLPAERTFAEGWAIGTPDLVFEIPEPYVVAAQGTVEYVYIRVPTKFKEDVWVQAAEARPGDRSVVHHIVILLDDHKLMKRLGRDQLSEHHFCGYAPGDMPLVCPPGSGKLIPAGSDLIFQIHYTPTGTRKTDRSKLGLILAKGPVDHKVITHGIAQPRFEIPAGADNHPVASDFTFPSDSHLLSFMPHMHLRGKSFRYEATYPDGRKEVLLSVPAYDFGWQSYYVLDKPRAMPKGTRIDCLAHFDNSSANLANPDPTKRVRWGEQTWEEMMIGYIDFSDDAPVNVKPKVTSAGPPPNVIAD
jgi:peroxiredoxin